MGVSITARNSFYSFDMGYFGFASLRENIADALDKDFGENYRNLRHCYTKQDFSEHDRIANRIIAAKSLDTDIIAFLYMSDCDGEISSKTCGKIYELIKDIDFNGNGFRYGALRHNDYEEFKLFLKDCYQKRKRMKWS